jgi:hypothetical protein
VYARCGLAKLPLCRGRFLFAFVGGGLDFVQERSHLGDDGAGFLRPGPGGGPEGGVG